MTVRRLTVAALAGLALLGAAPAPSLRRADVLLRHVTVIDVAGARRLADQAVVLRGDDIVAVGGDRVTARGWRVARTIDARGRYLIPGLWDMHVHFGGGPALIEENKALLPLYVAHGVTSVRDCAGDLAQEVLSWRDAVRDGKLFGPTIYTSGPKIEGLKPIWKGTIETGNRADVDAAIVRLRAQRVDFVKITDNTLDPDLFLYAVSAARRAGLKVSAHIPSGVTIRQALDAGLSSIEHLDYALKPGSPVEAETVAAVHDGRMTKAEGDRHIDAAFDPRIALPTWRMMAARGVVVTPTLEISRTIAYLDREDHRGDPYLAYIGPKLRQTYQWRIDRAAKATPAEVAARHARFERTASVLPMLARAGVSIMAGTDAGFLNSFDYPGIGLHRELAQYVRYGLSPAQALASATLVGPAWLGKAARYGAVAPGKAADLVLLTADPLRDIGATERIDSVILRGRVYDRRALDAMLRRTRDQVARWNAAD